MDALRKAILDKIKKEAALRYEEKVCELEERVPELIYDLGKELSRQMEKLKDKYGHFSENPVRHVVISYLRTSLLDRHPLYSIAMYDELFLHSEKECMAMWDITELSKPLYEIIDEAAGSIKKQSKLESYYLDEILFAYGDSFHKWIMGYMPRILQAHLMEDHWEDFYARNAICISAGEYRNQLVRMFEWRV